MASAVHSVDQCSQHHEAMVAIFVAWYNFWGKHETVKGTPAMAAGLADHRWSIKELLTEAANA